MFKVDIYFKAAIKVSWLKTTLTFSNFPITYITIRCAPVWSSGLSIIAGAAIRHMHIIVGEPLLSFTHNETPDGVSGTKGAYDSEIAGSQVLMVQVKGDQ